MKGTSDQYPEITIQSNNLTQVRYSIEPFTRTMMDKEQFGYEYDYVEIEGDLTRAKIIDAVIADTYSKDAEIALINNELASPGSLEYKAYQELRAKAKEIASFVQL